MRAAFVGTGAACPMLSGSNAKVGLCSAISVGAGDGLGMCGQEHAEQPAHVVESTPCDGGVLRWLQAVADRDAEQFGGSWQPDW